MQYEYGGWIIDATPEFFPGKYLAHARLTRVSPDDGEEPELHIERNIACFESKDLAVQCAYQWAIAWIDEREGGVASAQERPLDRATPSRAQQVR
ncbi:MULTISPECIES: hypothetical protein [Paraburkholderia]|uniref:Uncharacterized protein n=1 Tax=Paraburkholderia unamae TaxID=219649 RepID=A0ACC6RF32_9BURK